MENANFYNVEHKSGYVVERHVLKAVVDAYREYERAERAYNAAQDRLNRCLEIAGLEMPIA